MSHIVLTRPHGLTREKAANRIDRLLEDLRQEYDFAGQWENDVLHLERKGATGEVLVSEDDIEIRIRLALVLRPLRGKIEERLGAELDELFPLA
jgi:putative polyhydroxyalkanoate system protein